MLRAANLICAGQVTELRIFDTRSPTWNKPHIEYGYFDDPEKLVDSAMRFDSMGGTGAYIIPNPVDPALMARAPNIMRQAEAKGGSTTDANIVRRKYLLIDVDPIRPTGISSSDEQHSAALDTCVEVREWLEGMGFPELIYADSGNGGHLIGLIDVPTEDNGLIANCLAAIGARWNTPHLKIDTTTANPSRLFKFYGSVARKGYSIPSNPHRLSHIIHAPDTMEVVPLERLHALAAMAPAPAPKNGAKKTAAPAHNNTGQGSYSAATGVQGEWAATFLDKFFSRHDIDPGTPSQFQAKDGSKGRRWEFPVCPWNADHTNGSFVIIEFASGAPSAMCQHNGCKGKGWYEFRKLYEPDWEPGQGARTDLVDNVNEVNHRAPLQIIRAVDLIAENPELHEPIIDGLLRRGEVGNVVAAPKTGKTYLTHWLAQAVASGSKWLGYQTTQGRVLLIDNELHKPTIAGRLKKVREEYGLGAEAIENVDVLPLRGNLHNIIQLGVTLSTIPPRTYALIIIDSLYRTLPPDSNENDNAMVTDIYNRLDTYAARLDSAFITIHHTSKGVQGGKGITDVGAGAGAQSRAVDLHMVLRPHEESGAVVVEAVCRSFPPTMPSCWRLNLPLFVFAPDLDPAKLKTERKKKTEGESPKPEPPTLDEFLNHCVPTTPTIWETIQQAAAALNLSARASKGYLKTAISDGRVRASGGKGGSKSEAARYQRVTDDLGVKNE